MEGVARTVNEAVRTVRREAFIEAAQRLMQTKGYEQMSIQDLLDELNASRGAFYHYFDSKQALLEAVIERMVDAGLGAITPVLNDPELPAGAKLRGVFTGIGRWKTERKALVLALLQVWLSDHNAIVREKFRHRLAPRMVPVLAKVVSQGMAEEVFDARSPVETAQILVMLLLGIQDTATDLFLARQANTISLEDVERAIAGFNDAFERILGAAPGTVELVDRAVLDEWFG
jgi:AcrR family transcriptional regulator